MGRGQIGLSAFRCIMRDPLMAGIPLVLETPAADNPLESGELAIWKKEIELLYRIQAMGDEEWAAGEEGVREAWRKVRDEMNPPKERKPKGKGKGKGKQEEEEEE
jgi:AP endonuclease-1